MQSIPSRSGLRNTAFPYSETWKKDKKKKGDRYLAAIPKN